MMLTEQFSFDRDQEVERLAGRLRVTAWEHHVDFFVKFNCFRDKSIFYAVAVPTRVLNFTCLQLIEWGIRSSHGHFR